MYKLIINISKIFVGVLFIFSGLIKINDPFGLSYKMEEFFLVLNVPFLSKYALLLSVLMNTLEIVAGIFVLINYYYKKTLTLLFILIIFFTFLTGFAFLSGKFTSCGCFGDCIPLKPLSSFIKDIILFILILLLLLFEIKNPIAQKKYNKIVFFLVIIFPISVQFYIVKNLPFIDCLPYYQGANIQQQMQTPPNFIPDSIILTYHYKNKAGIEFQYKENELPTGNKLNELIYVKSTEEIIKGNDLKPKITNFYLNDINGNDIAPQLFSNNKNYILIFSNYPNQITDWQKMIARYDSQKIDYYIVTSNTDKSLSFLNTQKILTLDNTEIKTIARHNPTVLEMSGATIVKKYALH